jgi:hypothetical protein
MRLGAFIYVMMAAAILPVGSVRAQAVSGDAQVIDGIAARIDTDVITESEVRELAAFQTLVDGSAKPREQVLSELSDQWIVHAEAETARFPHPSDADIDNAYTRLSKLFATPQEFTQRVAAVGLTEAAIRRQLDAQLYLSRFIDFRFRPASEVDDAAVKKYYDDEFVPQLKQRNEPVPTLDKVQDTIREVLIQREINDRANQWLADTRAHLEIDVLPTPPGAAQ